MNILVVDLAAKFSAGCVMGEDGKVLHEFDSRGKSAFEFTDEIVFNAWRFKVTSVVLEDVPYGISSQAMVKPVLRLQGIIIRALGDKGLLQHALFLNPSTWQNTYPGVARGPAKDRVEAARQAALSAGYTPPDLVAQYVASLPEGTKILKKNTNPLEKVMTDYIDAFLMARWVLRQGAFGDLIKVKGVQGVYL